MQELQVKRQQIYGVQVIELTGGVDALVFAEFSATLMRIIEEVNPRIILECSRVTYIGSAHLRELIDLSHMAQARGGDVKCVGLPQTIQQVANLIAMGDLMEFYDDLHQAVHAFQNLPAAVTH
jgi:anti-anti-sigma factor